LRRRDCGEAFKGASSDLLGINEADRWDDDIIKGQMKLHDFTTMNEGRFKDASPAQPLETRDRAGINRTKSKFHNYHISVLRSLL
jgi:hypothetical protein